MRILQKEFNSRGYTYRQLERTDHAAIYAQYLDDTLLAYEVIKVTISPERIVMGRMVEEGEFYPPDSTWGSHGFTYMTFDRAMIMYNILNTLK